VASLSTIVPAVKGASSTSPAPARSANALAFLQPLRGASGKLEAAFRAAGQPLVPELPSGLTLRYEPDPGPAVSLALEVPQRPGVYKIAVEAFESREDVQDLRVITLVPFAAKKGGQIGSYSLGQWPYERGGAPSPAYANPTGFVEVTRENRDLHVSAHFTIGDFLNGDQPGVWPKYLLLDAGLIDKLELVIDELGREGYPVTHLAIMSAFRSPRYNQMGDTSGRSQVSRHMYGDATDIFVDNDRNGWTDDVDRDGRVDIRDAEVVAQAVERVESRYPALAGGVGIYPATGAHGPFTHVDVRGRPARWRYTGRG
jgi:Bacterial protein of unknown function (DUF882)